MPIAIKNSKIDISSEEITIEIAKYFSNYLKGGETIFLYGEMGVGKTTFVKHLINQFQINKKIPTTEVTSPTFNLLNEYEVKEIIIELFFLFLKNLLNEASPLISLNLVKNFIIFYINLNH